jgi:hypothetical protein
MLSETEEIMTRKPSGRLRKGKKAHNKATAKNITLYGRQAKFANRFSKLQEDNFSYYEELIREEKRKEYCKEYARKIWRDYEQHH